jgi:hypothetical protein
MVIKGQEPANLSYYVEGLPENVSQSQNPYDFAHSANQ